MPFVTREKLGFAVIETQPDQNLPVGEHLLRVKLALEVASLAVATRVRQQFQAKLLGVLTVKFVAGLGALLGAEVRIQSIGKRIVNGAHMAARPTGSLQHGHVMAEFHQFVGGAKTADAAAGHDDLFGATWCGCGFSLFGGEDGRR